MNCDAHFKCNARVVSWSDMEIWRGYYRLSQSRTPSLDSGHILEAGLARPGPGLGRGRAESRGQRLLMAGAGARAASHDLVWPCHGLPVLPVLPHCHSLLTPGSCSPTVRGRGHQTLGSSLVTHTVTTLFCQPGRNGTL